MKQKYINSRTGQYREVPTGFSWTTLFFGFFPALFRGHLIGFLVQLVVNIVVSAVTAGVGLIISWIVFACIYNGWYINSLKQDGFELEIPGK